MNFKVKNYLLGRENEITYVVFFGYITHLSIQERKQKRAEDAKNTAPAKTPLEATRQMLKRKVHFVLFLLHAEKILKIFC